MSNKSTWGGARQGGGRKLKGTANRVSIACRVNPVTAEMVRRMATEREKSVGEMIDLLVEREAHRVNGGTPAALQNES